MNKICPLILMLIFIVSCANNNLDIQGNWSFITTEDMRYNEAYIDSLNVIVFDQSLSFWPPRQYKKRENKLFLDIKNNKSYDVIYTIDYLNKNTAVLINEGSDEKIILIRRNKNDFTMDNVTDSLDDIKFISSFRVRMKKIMDSINNEDLYKTTTPR